MGRTVFNLEGCYEKLVNTCKVLRIVSAIYEVFNECLLVYHFLKVQILSVYWEYLSLQANSLN